MDSSVSPKHEMWFLRVSHHISNAVYLQSESVCICVGVCVRACVCEYIYRPSPTDAMGSYVLEHTVEVEFWEKLDLSAHARKHKQTHTHTHTLESSWNPNSSTEESDRPQHDSSTASVIAQQYSSATFFSLRFHSRNANFGAYLKILQLQYFTII